MTVGSMLRRPLKYMRTPLISVVLPDENQRLLLVVSTTPSEHSGFLNLLRNHHQLDSQYIHPRDLG